MTTIFHFHTFPETNLKFQNDMIKELMLEKHPEIRQLLLQLQHMALNALLNCGCH